MEGLSTPVAIVIAAGAILAGSVVLAVALFSQIGALKRLAQIVDDMRSVMQMREENAVHEADRRYGLEKRSLELAEQDRKAGVAVRMRGTLTLLEDSQEFKAAFYLVALGQRRIIADRVRAVLVNHRDPELKSTMEAFHNILLEPGQPYEGDITVSVRDLAKVNLPFVAEFGFLRESCRLLLTVEYEGPDGEPVTLEHNLLAR